MQCYQRHPVTRETCAQEATHLVHDHLKFKNPPSASPHLPLCAEHTEKWNESQMTRDPSLRQLAVALGE